MSRQNPLPQRPGSASAPAPAAPPSALAPRGGGRGRGNTRGRGAAHAGPSYTAPNTNANTNVNVNVNASGGYPYAGYAYDYNAYAYGNASGGYPANVSGGYPANVSGGYQYAGNASYGGYSAAGGYAGFAAGAYTYPYAGNAYGVYAAPAPTAPAPAPVPVPAPPTASATPIPNAWRNCSHPGCKYTGPGNDVAQHEGDRHLIFPHGKPVERSEEEERYLASLAKGGMKPTIAGTGIALESEEDIAAWVAERKRKWPTRARVEERKEEDAAATARGENPRKRPRLDAARAAEEWGRDPSTLAPSVRGKGARGRGRGDARAARGDRGDRGERARDPAVPAVKVKTDATKENKGGLVAYASSDVSSSDSDSSSDSSDSSSDSDADADEAEHAPDKPAAPAAPAAPVDTRPICRFSLRGKCRHGAKCRYRHDTTGPVGAPANGNATDAAAAAAPGPTGGANAAAAEKPSIGGPPKPPAPRQPAQKRANVFARPSMLGALLANPIQNTLSQLTQTIRFLVANDMLTNVESRAGEAEERERERKRVLVLEVEDAATDAGVDGEDMGEDKVDGDKVREVPVPTSVAESEAAPVILQHPTPA